MILLRNKKNKEDSIIVSGIIDPIDKSVQIVEEVPIVNNIVKNKTGKIKSITNSIKKIISDTKNKKEV